MKKIYLLCFSLLIISPTMFAQIYYRQNKLENIPDSILSNVDRMGTNECLLLTEEEGVFFNAIYQIKEEEFNMSGKKVAFLTGNIGKNKSNKKLYFVGEKSRLRLNISPNTGNTLYVFDAAQKEKNGGYDAAIVYGSKKLLSIKEVIGRLKRTQ